MKLEHSVRPFELKAIDEKGTFSGYGSVFGVEDSYGDIVAPGAFRRSLSEQKAVGRVPAMLWQHNTRQPIGVYTSVTEDSKGLALEGKFTLEVQAAREAYALMRDGALSGLSIGFITRKSNWDEKTQIRTLTDVDLMEVSAVTFPALDVARVEAVKSFDVDNVRELERALRDLGLSKVEAKALLADGFKGLLARRDAGASEGTGRDASVVLDAGRDAPATNDVLASLHRLIAKVTP